ncbi:MAG: hypothetical protein NDI66_06575 [Pseudomonas sp.]|nr:hypothetical protein [Pseudomonas sp.]
MDQDLLDSAHRLLRDGRVDDAVRSLLPALEASPPAVGALRLLARLALRGEDRALAARALQQGLRARPDDPELLALDAVDAKLGGDDQRLLDSARRAVAIDPAQPIAVPLLAEALRDRLALTEALHVTGTCLQRNPDNTATAVARADVLQFAGEADAAALQAHRAAQSGNVAAGQLACSTLLYLDDAPPQDVLAAHLAFGRRVPGLALPRPSPGSGGGPLRVGLLSPDLRRHPVGMFVEPLLAGWDRQRVRPFCYSDATPDAHTTRLRSRCPDWRDVRGRGDDDVARLMAGDAIEVLVDLAGHTHGSRPRLLASRVAPTQLGYLGYLFDTGLAGLDGVVGDAATLPASTACARRPLRLPGSFLCFAPPPDTPAVASRDSARTLTFGSFNHLAKLSPATVALWARVLRAVPGSRLLLCALGLADGGVRARIAARFAAAGVTGDRLELRPPRLDPAAFLSQYDDVDIALDPLPFNGGTTTLQALWQGVPVVTRPGARMAARSGLSILGAAGLGELVAADDDAFVATAVALAGDGARRAALRRTLRERVHAGGLCDARRFAAGFADLLDAAMRR